MVQSSKNSSGAPRHSVVIIGGGMAGFAVARELKARGVLHSLMLTADAGEYYAKPLLSHAYSKQNLATLRVSRETCEEQYGLTIKAHTDAVSINIEEQFVTTSTGQVVYYDQLVLATGATPRKPWEGPRIYSLNHVQDLDMLESVIHTANQVLVAGSGFVGLELANDWHRAGKCVTIASQTGPLQPLLPSTASTWVQSKLEAIGIAFQRGISEIQSTDESVEVLLSDTPTYRSFDMVLSAVGLQSNTKIAYESGLTVGPLGVSVDNNFVTSSPSVWALGDGIEQSGQTWRYVAAITHAAKVIASQLTNTARPVTPEHFPISLKCPDAPLVMKLPPLHAKSVRWETIASSADDLEMRATRYDTHCGYILGGAAISRRAKLDRWLTMD